MTNREYQKKQHRGSAPLVLVSPVNKGVNSTEEWRNRIWYPVSSEPQMNNAPGVTTPDRAD
ncbi:MAG: hypothetical protein WCX28_00200 [Bacteriovoracaceae bacterium]|nr:hypothetical protein [Bacteroidota bacterium]